jgi:hypothetical protein
MSQTIWIPKIPPVPVAFLRAVVMGAIVIKADEAEEGEQETRLLLSATSAAAGIPS